MLIDAKKLWIEGGYSLNNPYEIMIAGIRNYAQKKKVSQDNLDLILVDFFIQLRKDPFAFKTEGNVCKQCSCDITNSGTNAIHYLFKQIDNKQTELIISEQERFTTELNQKIITYMEEDNAKYMEEFGPGESVLYLPQIITLVLFIIGSFVLRYYYGL